VAARRLVLDKDT